MVLRRDHFDNGNETVPAKIKDMDTLLEIAKSHAVKLRPRLSVR